jgi:serine/threonine protein kinase
MADFSEIGVYRLKERLGRGGMAEVFRAEDPRTHRDVAVKIINAEIADDPLFRQRFAQEITLIAKLEHGGIVPLYDVGEAFGRPYLVMRYMAGGTLEDRMERGPLPLAEATRILTRLAGALDFAHQHGIIHRDLKPGNVLMDSQGDPYIADFGIAKLMGQSRTLSRTGMTMGTPSYMSPEQFRGDSELDGRADVYALGVLFFQMLSGKLPFRADTPHGLMYHHLETPVPDIRTLHPDLPADLHLVLQQALAKRPDLRYPSAGAFARDVQSIVEGKRVTPLPATSAAQLLTVPLLKHTATTPVPERPLPAQGVKPPYLIAGFVVLALLVVGVFLLRPSFLNLNSTPTAEENEAGMATTMVPTQENEVAPSPVDAEEETVVSPAGEDDYIIYKDNLDNGFEDWSWAVVDLENTLPVYTEDTSVAVDTSEEYSAAWFMNPEGAIETEDFDALHFAIHGGETGGQILLVGMSHDEEFPVEPHGVYLSDYLPEGPVAGMWSEVTIPLEDLEMEDETLFSVAFQSDVEGPQPLFYIDDIRLISAP